MQEDGSRWVLARCNQPLLLPLCLATIVANSCAVELLALAVSRSPEVFQLLIFFLQVVEKPLLIVDGLVALINLLLEPKGALLVRSYVLLQLILMNV